MLRRAYWFLVRLMVNLRFAVGLLIVIAVASIAGTLVGGITGDDSAQTAFFTSIPFSALMIVFMFALILAVLSRYPWKKTHIGWILTHAGLVVIVIGHMITQRTAINGRVDLFEGMSTDVATRVDGFGNEHWYLTADLPGLDGGRRAIISAPLEERPDVALDRTFVLPSGDKLSIVRYFPSYAERRNVEPDYQGEEPLNPAIRVELADAGRKHSEWLFADDAREQAKSFGGAFTAIYRRYPDQAARDAALSADGAAPAGEPAIVAEGNDAAAVSVPVAAAERGPQPLGESGYTVRVARRFERLRIVDNKAVEAEEGAAPNEAVEIEVSDGKGASEERWLFARIPDADSQGKLPLPFRLRFRVPGGALGAFPRSSLAVLDAPPAGPICLLTGADGGREVRPLVLGEPIKVGWLGGLEVTVQDRYLRTRVRETPWTSSYMPNRPALEVRLDDGSGRPPQSAWVVWQRRPRPIALRGRAGPVLLSYGAETVPLGFTVTLRDFVLKTYEGTDQPKSFESFVRVTPHDGEPAFDYHIYMNHVMDWAGWRFFQSSYDPETLQRSIFQVSKDPGKPVVYTGYLLVPLGLFFIVFIKPVLLKREAARRAEAGLAAKAAREASQRGASAGEAGAAAREGTVPEVTS